MKISLSTLSLAVWFSVVGTAAQAQAPLSFSNTAEAVRLYDESTLEQLRTRCDSEKSAGLFNRKEVTAIKNGYVAVHTGLKESERYSVFAYDGDKKSFILIDGQELSRGGALTLPLALPRDFSRCRIIRTPQGLEQLEVVHKESNEPSNSVKFDRLLVDALDIAHGLPNFDVKKEGGICEGSKLQGVSERLVADNKSLSLSACPASIDSLRERMNMLVRRVFER